MRTLEGCCHGVQSVNRAPAAGPCKAQLFSECLHRDRRFLRARWPAGPTEAAAKPPSEAGRLEAVQKNADIWGLIWENV